MSGAKAELHTRRQATNTCLQQGVYHDRQRRVDGFGHHIACVLAGTLHKNLRRSPRAKR